MSSYKDLIVWQKSIQLVKQVYLLTNSFPPKEQFALCTQLNRAVISVPSNIAEGQARHSKLDFRRFLHTARASLAEIDTQLIVAKELSYISAAQLTAISTSIDEIGRLLNGLINRLDSELKAEDELKSRRKLKKNPDGHEPPPPNN
jgi:four helix bundle protein